MNLKQKIMMAKQLERLGVDVIEAGFANASPEDFQSVKEIAINCEKTEICGLARCHEGDIKATIKALENAKKPRIHVFIATSDLHLEYKLKISRDEAIKKAIDGIKMAREFTQMVDFSPEDATRSDRAFLKEILTEAIKAGADTLNIPDTVGYSTPEEYGDLIRFIIEEVPGAKSLIISTHCHNDLGLAAANSLAGIRNGATQIECTINGIGERAGNAALEEIVMAIKTRPDVFPIGTKINTREIMATSKLLTQITGQHIQSNKAIVGKNAFAHEAGIHQHGILANRLTYEILKPEDVGLSSNQLILGKHSGRNALISRLQEFDIQMEGEKMEIVFEKFKILADKKKEIYDEDLLMLILEDEEIEKYQLKNAKIVSEKDKSSTAEIEIIIKDEPFFCSGEGDGPVSALYEAISKATNLQGYLKNFSVNALTPNSESIGIVNITWAEPLTGKNIHGYGSDTDITIAAGKALIDILNKRELYLQTPKKTPSDQLKLE